MKASYSRTESANAVVLTASGFEGRVSAETFDPLSWGDSARAVSSGGRGGAWFLRRAGGDWVLRHYKRGGLAARVSRDLFKYVDENRVRSFAELRLLGELKQRGLPVPAPVAACYVPAGLGFYRASILIERIADARTLLQLAGEADEATLREIGRVIARFHRAGVDHVDLNINNILIAPDGVFLVDFDKCRMREPNRAGLKWQRANLSRLRRSVDKEWSDWAAAQRDAVWHTLINGYDDRIHRGEH